MTSFTLIQSSPQRTRQTRQPSRLSVVSSALSSASEDEAADDVIMADTGDEDAEGEEVEGDDFSEDQVYDEDDERQQEEEEEEEEEEEDEDYDEFSGPVTPPSSRRRAAAAVAVSDSKAISTRSKASNVPSSAKSIKITLHKGGSAKKAVPSSRAPPVSTRGRGKVRVASTSSRLVTTNRRGIKTVVESDDDDNEGEEDQDEDAEGEAEDLEEEEGEEDEEVDVDDDDEDEEEEDELGEVPPDAEADGDEIDSDSLDEDNPEASYMLSMPKTARQLAREAGGTGSEGLLELPMTDDSKKTKQTEAEIALKRSEMARRRRYQSDKRLEDEKTETINRLLKKQVGRKSTREQARDREAGGGADDDDDDDDGGGKGSGPSRKKLKTAQWEQAKREELKQRAKPFFRTVISRDSTTVSVPILVAQPAAASASSNEATLESAQGLGPYMARWQQVFGSRPKIEVIDESKPPEMAKPSAQEQRSQQPQQPVTLTAR